MQLTPLNNRHATDAFSLYVFRQQNRGSNGTLIMILNCIMNIQAISERVYQFEAKPNVLLFFLYYFLFYKTSHVARILYLFIFHFISSLSRLLYFQPATLTLIRKSKLFKSMVIITLTHSTGEDLDF